MKIEQLKSYFLVILIIVSMALSWNIWTYTPSYEMIDNIKYIQEVQIGRKKLVNEVIMPKQVLLHKENKHYAMESPTDIKQWVNELGKLEINNVQKIEKPLSNREFSAFVQRQNTYETLYPDLVSKKMLTRLFSSLELDEEFSFDRISIDISNKKEEIGDIYFINYDKKEIYKGEVANKESSSLGKEFSLTNKKYVVQIPCNIENNKVVFIPKNSLELNRLTFITEETDAELFKEALFSDPKLVKKNEQNDKEIYTDGTRLLKILNNRKQMEFINPVSTGKNMKESSDFSIQNYNFVNDHGGFNAEYYFDSYNSEDQITKYRLYYNHLPIINKEKIDTITVQWGKGEIISYQRPLYKLAIPVDKEVEEIKLSSGNDVIKYLKEMKNINFNKIQDITLAYEIVFEDSLINVAHLIPIWAIKYDDTWMKFNNEDLNGEGRTLIGLE